MNTPPVAANRVIVFLRGTMDSFSWRKPYRTHDLSTADEQLSIGWEHSETGSVSCIVHNGNSIAPIPIWPNDVFTAFTNLNLQIVRHCCHNFTQTITAYWHAKLNGPTDDAEFGIGDRVRTMIGDNVKTERTGWVFSICRHYKRRCNEYQLLIGDSVYKKHYYTDDLKKIE